MNRILRRAILIVTLLLAGPAFAHHSRAMFDQTKQIKLVGTVKEFEWANPHCWIQVVAPDPSDPQAAPVEWGVEMDSPVALMRRGWKPGSLKVGDAITVVINPLRDGQRGGLVVSVIGPDGMPIGRAAETAK